MTGRQDATAHCARRKSVVFRAVAGIRRTRFPGGEAYRPRSLPSRRRHCESPRTRCLAGAERAGATGPGGPAPAVRRDALREPAHRTRPRRRRTLRPYGACAYAHSRIDFPGERSTVSVSDLRSRYRSSPAVPPRFPPHIGQLRPQVDISDAVSLFFDSSALVGAPPRRNGGAKRMNASPEFAIGAAKSTQIACVPRILSPGSSSPDARIARPARVSLGLLPQ